MSRSLWFLVGALTSVVGMVKLKTRIGSKVVTRRRRSQSSWTEFVGLPLDIVIEILSLLEWKDILRVRQTCKQLRDASIARPVWLRLVQWYSTTTQPRPFWPEKPLKLYTNRELESLILRWQSAKAGYALTQPKEREFSTSEHTFRTVSFHLVEGGRWLLFGARNGSVKFYDLNAECDKTLEAVALVPTPFEDDAIADVYLSIDMDGDAEYLTFRLGIMTTWCPSPKDPNPSLYARWIEICQVTSRWDEHGQVTSLRAERLACFREESRCPCESFTLGGRHVAYSMHVPYGLAFGKNIAVVDWTVSDSKSLVYPRRLICNRSAKWLALLPGDKLVCHDSAEIQLFDLTKAPLTTLCPTQYNQRPLQPPLASLSFFHISSISRAYCVGDSIRFAIRTHEGLLTSHGFKGLLIRPSNVPHTVECIDLLLESNHLKSVHLGYDCAVACDGQVPYIFQLSWPEKQSLSLISHKKAIQLPISPINFHFDSYSGRVVDHTVGRGNLLETVYIYDISSYAR